MKRIYVENIEIFENGVIWEIVFRYQVYEIKDIRDQVEGIKKKENEILQVEEAKVGDNIKDIQESDKKENVNIPE